MKIRKIVPKSESWELVHDFHLGPFKFEVPNPLPDSPEFTLTDQAEENQVPQIKWWVQAKWQSIVDAIEKFKATQG